MKIALKINRIQCRCGAVMEQMRAYEVNNKGKLGVGRVLGEICFACRHGEPVDIANVIKYIHNQSLN